MEAVGTLISNVSKPLFNGKMTESQKSGITRLVDAWEKYGYGLDTALAYILATSYHETGRRMQPVRETFATNDAQAIARLDKAFADGKLSWVKTPYWRSGWFGRGDVQLTHEKNYQGALNEAVKKEFGVDIHKDRDAVLRPAVSAFILIEGVTKGLTAKSDFTKYALETFINDKITDYANARKTVNPNELDSYEPIAKIARTFEAAIRKARTAGGEEFRGPTAAAVAPRIDLYDGKYHEEVENVQRRLNDIGYPEVGTIDGKWGGRTRAALLAFQADNQLKLEAKITDEVLAALMVAKPREVADARKTATVSDLRKEGAADVKAADNTQIGGTVLAGTGGIVAASEALDKAEEYSSIFERATAVLDPVKQFIVDNIWIVLIGVGALVIYQQWRLKQIRLEKHQTGQDVSQ